MVARPVPARSRVRSGAGGALVTAPAAAADAAVPAVPFTAMRPAGGGRKDGRGGSTGSPALAEFDIRTAGVGMAANPAWVPAPSRIRPGNGPVRVHGVGAPYRRNAGGTR